MSSVWKPLERNIIIVIQATPFNPEPKMFYKHWKKIALALTSFFWSSCDNNGTSPSTPEEPSSSSTQSSSATQSSSSIASSSATESSSSATNPPATSSSSIASSSSQKAKSSSSRANLFEVPEDLYGCPSDICGQISSSVEQPFSSSVAPQSSNDVNNTSSSSEAAKPNCKRYEGETTLTCDNGVTCQETETESTQIPSCSGEICPKYGVVVIKEKTYKCDDGKTYNEAEFKANYDITDIKIVVAKYGAPPPQKSEK